MRNWIVAVLLIMLLAIGTASAPFTVSEFERSDLTAVVNLRGAYENTCAVFRWNTSCSGCDALETFVVRTTSNNPEFDGVDTNTSNTWFTACTIKPGEWVKAIIYRVDTNTDGHFLNTPPDVNVTVNPGTTTQAGIYLMFQILTAIGAIASLLVLAGVMVLVFKRIGFKILWK